MDQAYIIKSLSFYLHLMTLRWIIDQTHVNDFGDRLFQTLMQVRVPNQGGSTNTPEIQDVNKEIVSIL